MPSGKIYSILGDAADVLAPAATRKELDKWGEYEVVHQRDFRISSGPMASFAYNGCNGLVLYKGGIAGLAHMHPEEDPEPYIEKIMEFMKPKHQKPKAIIMSLDGMAKMHRACRRKKIPVYGIIPYRRTASATDIIVVPSERQILMINEQARTVISYR